MHVLAILLGIHFCIDIFFGRKVGFAVNQPEKSSVKLAHTHTQHVCIYIYIYYTSM